MSKIMTAIVSINIIEKFNISLDLKVEVSAKAARVPGTTANLQEKMMISLYDLFYALMLPSGNDASLVLAYFLGSFCKKSKKH
jgi:D-alanyl-D-alanine carboxypeptidase